MPRKSKPLAEDEDDFEDDELPSDAGATEVLSGFPRDPAALPDPDASEFRDALSVTPNALGIHSVLEQELDAQQLEQEQATLDALEAMRALDHGESVEWKISRVGEDDEQYNGFLVTWSNSQMSLERIQRLLGGGKYYCKGFKKGKYFTNKTIKIAGPPALKKGEKPVELGQGGDHMQAFLSQMMMMDERRRQEEREYRRQQQEAEAQRAASRQALFLAALGPASTVLAAMFQGNRTDLGSILAALKPPDPMQQLAALKALVPEPGPAPVSALDTALVLMDKLKDLGGLGGAEGQTGWMDIVKEVVKAAGPSVGSVIEGAVQSAQAQAAERVRVQAAGAGGVVHADARSSDLTALPAPGPATQENAQMLSLIKHIPWLRAQVSRWVIAAQENAPVQPYATIFFIESPKDMEPQVLMELLSRSDWFAQLAQLDRRMTQFESWFTQLHQLLVHTLQTEYLNGAGAANAVPPSTGFAGTPNAGAAPARATVGEVQRPMKIPSLTGD